MSRANKFIKKPKMGYNIFKSPSVTLKNFSLHVIRCVSEERHIFVLGPPRSGTTLVQNIIIQHPEICGVDGETFYFCKRRLDLMQFDHISQDKMQELFWSARDKIELFDKIASYHKTLTKSRLFIEKTPEHALYLDRLVKWFPKSEFIFMIRDGRDSYVSAKKNPGFWRKTGNKYPYLWRDCMRMYFSLAASEKVKGIHYERLCADPVDTMREIMHWLGLEFSAQQLDSNKYGQSIVSSKRGHARLKEPITRKSVGIWRDETCKAYAQQIEDIAGNEMKLAGYL